MNAHTLSGNATHQIAVMGALGSNATGLSMDTLADVLPIERPAIAAAAGRLIARGLVERLEIGAYRLTLPGRESLSAGAKLSSGVQRGWRKIPVYAGSLRQRAWKAMKLSRRFAVGDLVMLAAHPQERDAHDSIRRFCHLLARAGYLVELPARVPGKAPSSNGFKQWRLIRDTGDAAPLYMLKQKSFKDRNTREVFPCV